MPDVLVQYMYTYLLNMEIDIKQKETDVTSAALPLHSLPVFQVFAFQYTHVIHVARTKILVCRAARGSESREEGRSDEHFV